jgi:CRISPR-associated protein Cas5t
MITVHVDVPYAGFRRSYARSFAESYLFAPPATVYGMLLSLVGERLRTRHSGVSLAFAYADRPRVATTLRKLARYKYGVPKKQEKLGNAPDYVESLCGLDFLCWIDSGAEARREPTLEQRVTHALRAPETVTRTGVLCLGLSDDAVNDIALVERSEEKWHWLAPNDAGEIELPIWIDHVGSRHTRWGRFHFDPIAQPMDKLPPPERFAHIIDPRSCL